MRGDRDLRSEMGSWTSLWSENPHSKSMAIYIPVRDGYEKYIFAVNDKRWVELDNVTEWEWFDQCSRRMRVSTKEIIDLTTELLWETTRYE